MKTEHLLIIRFSEPGNTADTRNTAALAPVVGALARQYPTLRITVLSQPPARTLFDGVAPNVGFMEADLEGEYRSVKGMNALYRRLAAKHFTAVADMHSILRSSYLRMRFNLSNHRVEHIGAAPKSAQPSAPAECYADVLARLGYPISAQAPAYSAETATHESTGTQKTQ